MVIVFLLFSAGCSETERKIVVDASGVDFMHDKAYGEYVLDRIEARHPERRLRIYKPWEVMGSLHIYRDDTLLWIYTEGLLKRTIEGRFEVHSGLLVIFTDEDHIFAALKYRFVSGTMFLVYWNVQSKRELTFIYKKGEVQ